MSLVASFKLLSTHSEVRIQLKFSRNWWTGLKGKLREFLGLEGWCSLARLGHEAKKEKAPWGSFRFTGKPDMSF